MPREVKPCGTRAAYLRHRKAGEEPCGPCVEAMREANRRFSQSRTPRPRKVRVLKPCGTAAAYGRHKKAGEEPCGPCRQAWSDYINDYNKKKRPPRGGSLPVSSPEGAHRAPCFGNPGLWDPRGEFESDESVRVRCWRIVAGRVSWLVVAVCGLARFRSVCCEQFRGEVGDSGGAAGSLDAPG